MTQRLNRLRAKMSEHDLDGFVIGAPAEDIFHTLAANRRYLSGFTGSMGWLLVTLDSAFIAVDFRDRKSTRLNSSHLKLSRMPSSA